MTFTTHQTVAVSRRLKWDIFKSPPEMFDILCKDVNKP